MKKYLSQTLKMPVLNLILKTLIIPKKKGFQVGYYIKMVQIDTVQYKYKEEKIYKKKLTESKFIAQKHSLF